MDSEEKLSREEVSQGSDNQTVESGNPRTSAAKRGPTPQGKRTSRRNSLSHGIFARVVLIDGEPQEQFRALVRGFREYFQPVGLFEDVLVEKLAAIVWRHRRLMIVDRRRTAEWAAGLVAESVEELLLPMELLLKYESALERAFDRTLGQLERAQRTRLGQSVVPRLALDITQ